VNVVLQDPLVVQHLAMMPSTEEFDRTVGGRVGTAVTATIVRRSSRLPGQENIPILDNATQRIAVRDLESEHPSSDEPGESSSLGSTFVPGLFDSCSNNHIQNMALNVV